MATHYRTCNLCEAMCGLAIEHEDGRILAIKGDEQDPLSHGHICPKAVALQDLHTDPDRLRQPMRRTASGWEPISWAQALDETAARLYQVREDHGRNAVATYAGNPTVHNHGALLMLLPFLKAIGSRNRFSATSVDQLPHMLACLEMFGNQTTFPVPDIDRTDFFLVLGANPMASNGSLMTAPNMRGRLKALKKRGGKLVVVDPRYTETARLADQHLFVRPGTDAYLLLGMLHVLFAEKRVDLRHLADKVNGLDVLAHTVADWPPERVAPFCGMAADDIAQLARDFADAPTAAGYCRVGTSTAPFSSVSAWLMYALNIVSGNFDRPGGIMFTQPAFDVIAMANMSGNRGSFGRYHSRVRQLPEFGGEFPVTTLADEILTPGDGQVRALVTHAGNPVLSCPDGQRLDEALESLDFMVAIDFYINETTRHADIILPPTGQLEHAQFDPAFHAVAVRNTIKFSPALFEPAEDTRHDWQILLGLIGRLQRLRGQSRAEALTEKLLWRMGDEGIVDLALRLGPYGQRPAWIEWPRKTLSALPVVGPLLRRLPLARALSRVGPWSTDLNSDEGLTLKKVKAAVHGIDLGPLRTGLENRVVTDDGRIRLHPERYQPQLAELARQTPPAEEGLLLIGRRHVRSNNSWMHNSQRLVKGKGRCDVMMHPDDARAHGISDGDVVTVSSPTGAVTLPALVSEEIMPGVVSVPHGWGHGRDGVKLSVASAHAGASVNDVIGTEQVESLTGMAILNGVPVSVSRAADAQA